MLAQTEPPPTAIEPTQSRSFRVRTTALIFGSISLMRRLVAAPDPEVPVAEREQVGVRRLDRLHDPQALRVDAEHVFAIATQTEPAPTVTSVDAVWSIWLALTFSGIRWIVRYVGSIRRSVGFLPSTTHTAPSPTVMPAKPFWRGTEGWTSWCVR